ncbi:fimbria/pilus outer membrane usher protein [Ewingella americana]|uniref:fimbria/pilus outer membrane usher protein n=1 Tax=Ewingella americana TaxID=41202 RepID=UPI000C2FCB32|nr:fimbria/pilus outer membrane usher protein [Ewingella americana]MRT03460.1 fimbria/pilus outer membrane usher protein [Ewingella americana]PKB87179.1 pilus assembly protein PapC [Ewingella americana]
MSLLPITKTAFPQMAGRLSTLSLLVAAALPAFATVEPKPAPQEIAQNVEFDASFLNLQNSSQVDLARFANGASATPGSYRVAIYVNNEPLSNQVVEFKSRPDNSVYPCLTAEIVNGIPFNEATLPKDALSSLTAGAACLDLQTAIPNSHVNFDSNEQRLDLIIPQLYMQRSAHGAVNPALWDSGITAAMLGYNLSAWRSEAGQTQYNSLYAGINAGFNLGGWYLRHNGSYNASDGGQKSYESINSYAQHDIPALRGRLLIGQSSTQGQVFDTLPFSGVQLASDERMLPESQRGYAPDIHGIARTNARVTVRQSNQVIYETTVPPGEFLINDLYPTGYGGDLEVNVREADGSEQRFLVPYASVAQLLRPGSDRYSLLAGTLHNDSLRDNPQLYQGTYQRGITNAVTAYAGVQLSQNYYAAEVGSALGTPFGALAADITQARVQLNDQGRSSSGQSYRLSYSKAVAETSSNISLAAYRFSTGGFMDFLTAMQTRDALANGLSSDTISRAKNRLTLTAAQGLPGDWGQFYISSSLQNYWNKSGNDKQYQLGYNNRYRSLSWGINAGRSQSGTGQNQTNYQLTFSFPLGRADSTYTPQMRVDFNRDSNGHNGQQATISGTAGRDSQYSYSASGTHSNTGGDSGAFNGQYRSPYSALNMGYSTGRNYQSVSAGASGTLIAHSGGVTASPYLAETFALVEAKGANGAHVSNYPGVVIDALGYAAVPYLNPYQINEISIDPKGTKADVELDNTTQRVAPYSGAVVKVAYASHQGTPVLINASLDGQPVPFGADVIDSKGNRVGSVGQAGQVYARVAEQKGELRVKWADSADAQCRLRYHLMPQAKNQKTSSIQQFTSSCSAEQTPQPTQRLASEQASQQRVTR